MPSGAIRAAEEKRAWRASPRGRPAAHLPSQGRRSEEGRSEPQVRSRKQEPHHPWAAKASAVVLAADRPTGGLPFPGGTAQVTRFAECG